MKRNVVGTKGAQLDLLIKQGSTFSFKATISDKNNSAMNLTGASFSGMIRKSWNSVPIIVSVSTIITNATAGMVEISLSSSQTGAMAAGEDERDENSQYVWDYELLDSTGKITPIFYGNVSVFREITKP